MENANATIALWKCIIKTCSKLITSNKRRKKSRACRFMCIRSFEWCVICCSLISIAVDNFIERYLEYQQRGKNQSFHAIDRSYTPFFFLSFSSFSWISNFRVTKARLQPFLSQHLKAEWILCVCSDRKTAERSQQIMFCLKFMWSRSKQQNCHWFPLLFCRHCIKADIFTWWQSIVIESYNSRFDKSDASTKIAVAKWTVLVPRFDSLRKWLDKYLQSALCKISLTCKFNYLFGSATKAGEQENLQKITANNRNLFQAIQEKETEISKKCTFQAKAKKNEKKT